MGKEVNVERGKQDFQRTVPAVVKPSPKAQLEVRQMKRSAFVGDKRSFDTDVVFKTLTDLVASELHEQWRAPRKRNDGTFEERWKPDGNSGTVDIANTPYSKLPPQWQAENKASAEGAVAAVQKFHANIERVSSEIHEQWLNRNGEWAEPHQKLPYSELLEEEKEKDRVVARIACRVLGLQPK